MVPPTYLSRFPHLFQESFWPWGPTQARFTLLSQPPPAALVANVNLVPRIAERWLVIQLADGSWELPGGTLEPGETYLDCIQRELMEEAGAQILNTRLVGAWHCHSLADKPYRPHLPHPDFYRLVLSGEVRIQHSPLNPTGAEIVTSVLTVPLGVAVETFNSQGRPDLAELYQLVAGLLVDFGAGMS